MDFRYILEVKPKGFDDGLGDVMRQMEDTRIISKFLALVPRRMIGSTRHQNAEARGKSMVGNPMERGRIKSSFIPFSLIRYPNEKVT